MISGTGGRNGLCLKSESGRAGGFTLIEVLVVIAVIVILLSILAPSFQLAKRKVRTVIGAVNQRQTTAALAVYATDYNDWFPESVATIGSSSYWNWQEPMMMTGYRARSPRIHRSMSAYLKGYIDKPEVLYCPNAPKKYPYLTDAWDAGDDWDNPDTAPKTDPMSGSYCFYWNYTGYLEDRSYLFNGPSRMAGGKRQSDMLISDYFGYDHHRTRGAFASCEKLRDSTLVTGTLLSSSVWSKPKSFEEMQASDVTAVLNAGFTDGHVEKYSPAETTVMRVIWNCSTNEPYPQGLGPGNFYIPVSALD